MDRKHREGTIPVRAGEELDVARLETWLRERMEGMGDGPLMVAQYPAGASNLTYRIRAGEWEAVLRRPPLGPLPPKAHDMEREAKLLEKIHPVFPLAPKPLLLCTDPEILGAPFYVMEKREGVLLNHRFPEGTPVTPELCGKVSESVADTLARLHGVDWREAGLEGFGHPDGFLERQVRGWIGRYGKALTDDVPRAEELASWLTDSIPASPAPTVIHNDFKLNNMLMDPADMTRPVALLDWEMATIGDPLFDLAVSLSYWVRPEDPEELRRVLPTVTTLPGFLSREQMMERYASASGRDLSSMDFYMTFAYFKLAVILQQIYARWQKGQTRDDRFASFGTHVGHLIRHAESLSQAGRV